MTNNDNNNYSNIKPTTTSKQANKQNKTKQTKVNKQMVSVSAQKTYTQQQRLQLSSIRNSPSLMLVYVHRDRKDY